MHFVHFLMHKQTKNNTNNIITSLYFPVNVVCEKDWFDWCSCALSTQTDEVADRI